MGLSCCLSQRKRQKRHRARIKDQGLPEAAVDVVGKRSEGAGVDAAKDSYMARCLGAIPARANGMGRFPDSQGSTQPAIRIRQRRHERREAGFFAERELLTVQSALAVCRRARSYRQKRRPGTD